jgi:hypothetical protein
MDTFEPDPIEQEQELQVEQAPIKDVINFFLSKAGPGASHQMIIVF